MKLSRGQQLTFKNGEKCLLEYGILEERDKYRLMKMFSFEGDTVLGPFLGSGTTTRVAFELERNSIGYEIGFKSPNINDTKENIKRKVHFNDIPISERSKVFPTLI